MSIESPRVVAVTNETLPLKELLLGYHISEQYSQGVVSCAFTIQ